MTSVLTGDLFIAIEAFVLPDPLDPAPGSLWQQLLDSSALRAQSRVFRALRSRPPVSTEVVSLVDQVRRMTALECRELGIRARFSTDKHGRRVRATPSELFAINAALVSRDSARAIDWVARMQHWHKEAVRVLGLVSTHISLPRDVRCIDCDAREVTEHNADGEVINAPAMRLTWGADDAIEAVWCAACGVSRPPSDLYEISVQFAIDATIR